MRDTEANFNAWMSHTLTIASAHEDFLGTGMEMPVSADHLKRETKRRESK